MIRTPNARGSFYDVGTRFAEGLSSGLRSMASLCSHTEARKAQAWWIAREAENPMFKLFRASEFIMENRLESLGKECVILDFMTRMYVDQYRNRDKGYVKWHIDHIRRDYRWPRT